MKNSIVYLDDVSWFEDPYNAIDRLMDEYDEEKEEKRKTKFDIKHEDGTIEVVDFENDPDWAFLLEQSDEFFDANGEYIFNKKIVKNWKYFNQKQDDFEFYIDKAKYILKTYWHYKEEIDYMKQGLHMRKMSYEMLVSVLDNMKFMERCMATRLSEYSMYLELIYKDGLSYLKVSEMTGEAKSSIQTKVEKGVRQFARMLIAKDKFAEIGEKMLENAVHMEQYEKEVELKEKLELVGELAVALQQKLKELDNK